VSCAGADTPATAASVAQMTAAVDCLVNQQRLRFGLPRLDVSGKLNQSAQRWSTYLAQTNQLFHGNVARRMSAVGYDWQEGAENIATTYLTPRDVVAAWMASPDHCQNMLDPDYRDMGTGESPIGAGPATWTQDFGLQVNQNPLSSDYTAANGCPYSVPASPATGSSPSTPGSGPTSSSSPWPSAP
jgi:uncharacterized protein YkwD